MLPFSLDKKPVTEVGSVPHPELTPIYDYECEPPQFRRDPMLSLRDYSSDEIERAKAAAKAAKRPSSFPTDIREYCHNNGIDWHVEVRQVSRR